MLHIRISFILLYTLIVDFLIAPTVVLLPDFLKSNKDKLFIWLFDHYNPWDFFLQALEQRNSWFWILQMIIFFFISKQLYGMIQREHKMQESKKQQDIQHENKPNQEKTKE